jgi:hypothetical protein
MGCCVAATFVIALVLHVARRLFGRAAPAPMDFPPPATRPAPHAEFARGSLSLELAS